MENQLAQVYLKAAQIVARHEWERPRPHTHESACSALEQASGDWYTVAFAHFSDWFGQPRNWWFGRVEVFEPLKETHPKDYRKRVREVLANQQARVYALLLMKTLAERNDLGE